MREEQNLGLCCIEAVLDIKQLSSLFGRHLRCTSFLVLVTFDPPIRMLLAAGCLDILHISLADEPNASLSVVGSVSLLNLTDLESARLDNTTSNRSLQLVGTALDGKVGEGDLIRVAVDDGGHAKVVGSDLVVVDVQFKVSSVVDIVPLQLVVGVDEPVGGVVGGLEGDVLAVRARGGDGGTGEFDTDAVVAGSRVVAFVVEPDEVGDPRGVGVTGHDNVVANAVVVEVSKSAVAVGLVAVPGIVVKRVGVTISSRLVDAGEDGLRTDQTPSGTTIGGLRQLVVEPVLLSATHHRSSSIVAELVNVIGVPVKIGDGAVVLTSVEHDQVEQTTNAEASPDTEVVVHLNLTNGHPLEVGSDSVHLSLINRNTTITDERCFGVVELRSTIAVCVVRDLVVVPDGDPGVILVGSEKIEIGAVGSETLAVVVEGGDDTLGLGNAVDAVAVAIITVASVLVNVVTKVDDVVDRVLTHRVSEGVEEAEGCQCVSRVLR